MLFARSSSHHRLMPELSVCLCLLCSFLASFFKITYLSFKTNRHKLVNLPPGHFEPPTTTTTTSSLTYNDDDQTSRSLFRRPLQIHLSAALLSQVKISSSSFSPVVSASSQHNYDHLFQLHNPTSSGRHDSGLATANETAHLAH